ncbi:MAG TPA: acyltransferase family protein [Anaeromyxobacter sp.]|nr:acyltransferase family protein [Anaeromyxobacter sp.]
MSAPASASPLPGRPPAPSASFAAAPRPRLAALDAARALGVLAMVCGHTLDAVLSPQARDTGAMTTYWHARGFTAPLFLAVSGWAVTLAIARSGARGWAVPLGRARRVLLLLVIGYGLRWPGWALDRFLALDRDVWAHFLAFDALHTIAVALLLASLALALPLGRAARAAVLAALGALAVWLGRGAGIPGAEPATAAGLPAWLPAMALAQAVGGTSAFPLVPWSAYFFAGTLIGLLAPADRRGAVGTAFAGAILVGVTVLWSGLGDRAPGDPVLIGFRLGVVLLVLGALELVPARWAARAAPLGRSSLGVYAIHLPIVYGWSTVPGLSFRLGRTLGVGEALAVAALVLGASFVLSRLLALAGRLATAGIKGLRRPAPPPAG